MNVDTRRIESMFFELDSNFKKIRDLKENFIDFNSTSFDKEDDVKIKLEELIEEYRASDIYIFVDFSQFLQKYSSSIIASFTIVEVSRKTVQEADEYYARLSNGPMESSNFDYTRNRILWSTRKKPQYLGIPKTKEQVHRYRGKKRGKYKKKKK